MKKILTLVIAILMIGGTVRAQLPDGSVAPDFTMTDLDGNTWNLYDLLDQGKYVILDFSATWCGPCWNYHKSGALEELYTQYGPDGTDELMVFMIEGDPNTNIECLYNQPGCNSSTLGDWVTGTPYPIINDDFIANDYKIGYWPTLYHICPNRIVTELPQPPASAIYAVNSTCTPPSGVNNAGILDYTGFSGVFCVSTMVTPSILMQNLGSDPLTSAKVELRLNGNIQETLDWTGNLLPFQLETISFSEVTIMEDTEIEINILEANGTTDDDNTNNSVITDASLSLESPENQLILEIRTDGYPTETYWEVRRADNTLFYAGGNAAVAGGTDNSGAYTGKNTTYTESIDMPGDGCFEFIIFDSYGDGMTDGGNGYYKLTLSDGTIVAQSNTAFSRNDHPFSIVGSTPINDNAAIVRYQGPEGEFCGSLQFEPTVTVQNLGNNAITSMELVVSTFTDVLSTTIWSGNIESGDEAEIVLDLATVSETPIAISIVSVNGNMDEFDYRNEYFPNVARGATTESTTLEMQLKTDSYAYELYWQLTNSNGDVIASGGNTVVGPDGGGKKVAKASDPGAYSAGETVTETIQLPGGANDCYTFLLVDDYGDGMVDGGGGFLVIADGDNNILIDKDYTSTTFKTDLSNIDVSAATSIDPISSMEELLIFPNPASNQLHIRFELSEATALKIALYNVLGQELMVLKESIVQSGTQQIQQDIQSLESGLYYIRFTNGRQQTIQSFNVVNP